MSARNRIFEKLRQAMRPASAEALPDVRDADVYRDYPSDPASLFELFKTRLEELRGEVYRVGDEVAASDKVVELADSVGGSVMVQPGEPMASLLPGLAERLCDRLVDAAAVADSADFARVEVGVTAADFLIARTGSVLLRTISSGGRRLSVLPPFHIVVARASQMVPSLEEALNGLKGLSPDWSYAALITGPSRTADIEKILVLGAHGPKRLAVVVVDAA
ncbi:MAG: lactate utilization protein [candidate division KSB1 bacterium]|nr:lactate utilization protein [candidate division KSB1 bacterium]